jgi:hypothetical protein
MIDFRPTLESGETFPYLTHVLDWESGETLYSWCAKTHLMLGTSARGTGASLFGHERAFKEHDVPIGLLWLSAVTRGLLGLPERILRERTVLGAYLPFISMERQVSFVAQTLSRDRLGPKLTFGLHPATLNVLHSLRFCAACARSAAHPLGYAPWLTEAQLPGVWVCVRHQRPLVHALGKQNTWTLPDPTAKLPVVVHSDSDLRLLVPIAEMAQSLSKMETIDVEALRSSISLLLRDRFTTFKAKTMNADRIQTAWKQSSIARWLLTHENLAPLALDSSWIGRLVLSRGVAHPIRWLLCWSFLHEKEELGSLTGSFVRACSGSVAGHQLTLWDEPSISGAMQIPASVRNAFERSATLSEVAAILNVHRGTVSNWVRTTPALKRFWLATKQEYRATYAMQRVSDWLGINSTANLSTFTTECSRDLVWLGKHFPAELAAIAKRIPSRRSNQRPIAGVGLNR